MSSISGDIVRTIGSGFRTVGNALDKAADSIDKVDLDEKVRTTSEYAKQMENIVSTCHDKCGSLSEFKDCVSRESSKLSKKSE